MRKFNLSLRTVAYDIKTYPKEGCNELKFFDNLIDSEGGSSSSAELDERSLIEFLFGRDELSRLIKKELSLEERAPHAIHVTTPFVSSERKPGDIDLIVCDEGSPNEAVAVEFKRVKVRRDRINRLHALERVSSQVDGLHDLGFSRTYLGVIVITDGRHQADVNFVSRGLSSDQFGRVLEVADAAMPSSEIGILYIEIIQTVGKPIQDAGMVCVAVIRDAKPRFQHGDLSDRIENFMNLK